MAGILIVDDDDGVRYILRRVLAAGHDVIEARDGEEALRIYHRERPDLVITDLSMPGMNGDELIRKLKSCSSAPSTIAITGVEYALPYALQDADFALKKPIDVDVLEDTVGKLLGDQLRGSHREINDLDPGSR